MDQIEQRLSAMGLFLPDPWVFPRPNRTGCTQVGRILFLSGHGRDIVLPSGKPAEGKIDSEISVAEGYEISRLVALSMLASVKHHVGCLDRVARIIRLFGMVNSSTGFARQPEVIDGASDFFYELYGPQRGQHARSAVGMAELPHRISVEIQGEFEIEYSINKGEE